MKTDIYTVPKLIISTIWNDIAVKYCQCFICQVSRMSQALKQSLAEPSSNVFMHVIYSLITRNHALHGLQLTIATIYHMCLYQPHNPAPHRGIYLTSQVSKLTKIGFTGQHYQFIIREILNCQYIYIYFFFYACWQ